MSKGKAALVTIIVMALLGGMIWCFWNYQIRTYYVVAQVIALYGFIVGGFHLSSWLQKDDRPAQNTEYTYSDLFNGTPPDDISE